jgi:hypothetical protein
LPVIEQTLHDPGVRKRTYIVDNVELVQRQYLGALVLQQKHHFASNIDVAGQKIDQCYTLTDDSPAYLATIVLYSRHYWLWIGHHWSYNVTWIKKGEQTLLSLWQQHWLTLSTATLLLRTRESLGLNVMTACLDQESLNEYR